MHQYYFFNQVFAFSKAPNLCIAKKQNGKLKIKKMQKSLPNNNFHLLLLRFESLPITSTSSWKLLEVVGKYFRKWKFANTDPSSFSFIFIVPLRERAHKKESSGFNRRKTRQCCLNPSIQTT